MQIYAVWRQAYNTNEACVPSDTVRPAELVTIFSGRKLS